VIGSWVESVCECARLTCNTHIHSHGKHSDHFRAAVAMRRASASYFARSEVMAAAAKSSITFSGTTTTKTTHTPQAKNTLPSCDNGPKLGVAMNVSMSAMTSVTFLVGPHILDSIPVHTVPSS
jgi:hypothetical protein